MDRGSVHPLDVRGQCCGSSDQTLGNILKRRDLVPAPERKTTTTGKKFIRTHMDVLVATDFFTAEVWTLGGLVTYCVLLFISQGLSHATGEERRAA